MTKESSAVEAGTKVPAHVAIIMDGNGRWAEQRGKIRHAGHKKGVDAVRRTIEACGDLGVKTLTLFAFSSENWRRPAGEVSVLMDLFFTALQREIKRLHANGIRLRVIGDISAFSEKLQKRIRESEELTKGNTRLLLQVAANYGGRWDIAQAVRVIAEAVQRGEMEPAAIDEAAISSAVLSSDPDLLIRTGGECRISNFLLWQCAYSELYFTDTLWPDFDAQSLADAVADYSSRQRRFGKTGKQVLEAS